MVAWAEAEGERGAVVATCDDPRQVKKKTRSEVLLGPFRRGLSFFRELPALCKMRLDNSGSSKSTGSHAGWGRDFQDVALPLLDRGTNDETTRIACRHFQRRNPLTQLAISSTSPSLSYFLFRRRRKRCV